MPAEWTDAEIELLSAYIDEQLDDSERTALEARLAQDADLRQELTAMRQTVALLHSLPTIRAPRAFTLTPEMVGQTAVPIIALTQPQTAEKKLKVLPPRRVWWIPAASAAGVVLLAGVFLLTQATSPNAPSAGQVAFAVTPTLEGSSLNTVVQDVVVRSSVTPQPSQESGNLPQPVPPVSQSSAAQATQMPTEEEVPRGGDPVDEQSDQQSDGTANSGYAPAPISSGGVVSSTAQPTQTDLIQQQPEPRSLPSATAVEETDDAEAADNAPRQMASPTLVVFEVQSETEIAMPTSDPLLDMQSGGGGPGSTTAIGGMEGINPNPDAPGFTVATMSALQVTEIAMYNAVPDEVIVSSAAASVESLPVGNPEPATSAKREPIWIRWFNILTDWVQRVLAHE